jgi:hypothetical protein
MHLNLSSNYIPWHFQYVPPIPSFSTLLTSALVPINLISETEVVGPTTIDAVDCITLGIPCESDYGTVSVESFTLQDGKLYEQNGLIVKFQPVEGLEENEYGVDKSSVLKAKECDGGCDGGFCVDQNGYLVSTKPLSTFHMFITCFCFGDDRRCC